MDLLAGLIEALSTSSTYVNAALFAGLLIFAASGEWIAERSGTINISVEGMLLAGAFASAAGYTATNSFIVGIVCGVLGGITVASVQAQMSHRLAADQFVVGLTLNILIVGLAGFLAREVELVTKTAGRLDIPVLRDIPLIGGALFSQPWPFSVLFVIIPLSWWLMFRTRWGLEVRAAGEDPQAADVSGIEIEHHPAPHHSGVIATGIDIISSVTHSSEIHRQIELKYGNRVELLDFPAVTAVHSADASKGKALQVLAAVIYALHPVVEIEQVVRTGTHGEQAEEGHGRASRPGGLAVHSLHSGGL